MSSTYTEQSENRDRDSSGYQQQQKQTCSHVLESNWKATFRRFWKRPYTRFWTGLLYICNEYLILVHYMTLLSYVDQATKQAIAR